MNRAIEALLLPALVWSCGCGSATLGEAAGPRDDKRPSATDPVPDTGGAGDTKRLQIVFMFGQSEMVGHARVASASYMLRKPIVPPRDATLNAHKAMLHQINGAYLYWKAMYSYGGPEKKKELMALLDERARFKGKFRQHVIDELNKNDGNFRGKHYARRRGFWLFNMCDEEAEKVGITPKIRAILDGPDNEFNVAAAYEQLLKDGNGRYERQLELNKSLLNGTTREDFAAFAEAAKVFEAAMKKRAAPVEERRRAYAALAEKHLHMPVAKRTRIVALGAVAGTPRGDAGNVTLGPLSVGYGGGIDTIGPEYAAGMALEREVDAPVLIVKCAWNDGRSSISQLWRASSLDGVETPREKEAREAWNKSNPDKARPAPEKTGRPAWAWERVLPQVKDVLGNLKTYHPDYDPQAGHDIAGMIWFQGLSDRRNPEYALHLEAILREFRNHIGRPDMPVVCATVGDMPFRGESDDTPVNRAMREVANIPAFRGTIDLVEAYRWFPSEFSVLGGLFHKRKLSNRSGEGKALQDVITEATSVRGRHRPPYLGSASFYLLAGDEAGARLAKMIGGQRPAAPMR